MVTTDVDDETELQLEAEVSKCKACGSTREQPPEVQGKLRAVVADEGERLDLFCHPDIVRKLTAQLKAPAWGDPGSDARADLRAQLEGWCGKMYCLTVTCNAGRFYLNGLHALSRSSQPVVKRQRLE